MTDLQVMEQAKDALSNLFHKGLYLPHKPKGSDVAMAALKALDIQIAMNYELKLNMLESQNEHINNR